MLTDASAVVDTDVFQHQVECGDDGATMLQLAGVDEAERMELRHLHDGHAVRDDELAVFLSLLVTALSFCVFR